MSSTPIFDLEEDPPRPPRRRLRMLVAACIGLLLGGVLILADQGYLPDWHWPTANGLLLIPALYVTIAVHELGHALAGKLVGFDTGGIAIGGFVVLKSGQNWVVQFDWRRWSGGFFKPLTKADELGISRHAWMIAGGPIASAILAVLCLAGLELYGNDRWSITGTLFWTSLVAALGTAVPFSAGLQNSDGALLRMLHKDAEGTRRWLALIELQTRDTRGERPRDWDQERVKEIMSAPSASNLYVFSQLLAFYYCLDQHADEAALERLENLLASSGTMPLKLRHQIFLEAACSSAHIRHNPAQARVWRTRTCKRHKPEWLEVIDASIAMHEGRYDEALQHWEAAQARVVRRRLDSGIARFAKERWSAYQEECRRGTLASILLS